MAEILLNIAYVVGSFALVCLGLGPLILIALLIKVVIEGWKDV